MKINLVTLWCFNGFMTFVMKTFVMKTLVSSTFLVTLVTTDSGCYRHWLQFLFFIGFWETAHTILKHKT